MEEQTTQATVGQIFARMAASILDINDATEDSKQRERVRRAVLDATELAQLRIVSKIKLEGERR